MPCRCNGVAKVLLAGGLFDVSYQQRCGMSGSVTGPQMDCLGSFILQLVERLSAGYQTGVRG